MNDSNVVKIERLAAAADALRDARRILAYVGSGLSVASGIPVFRGPLGAYSDPAIAQWVQASTFDINPVGMMRWYQDRRDDLKRVWPNAGHYALAQLGRTHTVAVATQNVDGLVEQSSHEEDVWVDVMHLHGVLSKVKCHDCGALFSARGVDLTRAAPCAVCGGRIRPAVTWFGEELPAQAWDEAMRFASRAEVCLMIGTSGIVYPAATVPEAAQSAGAVLIEINLEETALTADSDIVLRGAAEVILPELVSRVGE